MFLSTYDFTLLLIQLNANVMKYLIMWEYFRSVLIALAVLFSVITVKNPI